MKCGTVPFGAAQRCQRALAALRGFGTATDSLLLAEHPHTFAVGRNASPGHLLWKEPQLLDRGVLVRSADRGGGITYHGPGQLVAYPVLHLGKSADLHRYLRKLEAVVVLALSEFGVEARPLPGLTGVWVGDRKIAAIGIKFSRGVVSHGVSINVSCDLTYFDGIIACGLEGVKSTSLSSLGTNASVEQVADIFAAKFAEVFGLEPIGDGDALWEKSHCATDETSCAPVPMRGDLEMSESRYHCAHGGMEIGHPEATAASRAPTANVVRGRFICPGESACALRGLRLCRPKVAECRHASQPEPKKGDYRSEPGIVGGVYCLGEDFCVKEECTPEPRSHSRQRIR